jgi:DNA-binding transcriptional MerR regulator
VQLVGIGEFARRSVLSVKALRLYDELGLLPPARVDPDNGYRWYRPDQVEQARLVALLRRLDMPLARIGALLAMDGPAAAAAVGEFWARVQARGAEQRVLVDHLRELLGGESTMHGPQATPAVRHVAGRDLITVTRHLHAGELGDFLGAALGRFRTAAPPAPLDWPDNCPFVVYYGEVSADGDGPVELCRPYDAAAAPATLAADTAGAVGGAVLRHEPAHDEVYLRLPREDAPGSPLEHYRAIERWCAENRREPASAPRQVMIADWRTAQPDTPVFDFTVPLR